MFVKEDNVYDNDDLTYINIYCWVYPVANIFCAKGGRENKSSKTKLNKILVFIDIYFIKF